ncbi:MAG: M23 family metallopeptidase [Pseudomonadota bacterium]
MALLSLRRPFFVPFLLTIALGACTFGEIGDRISGDLLLNTGAGQTLAVLKNPTEGALLTSRYGMRRHPITGANQPHRGIDLAAPIGTPVLAAADGTLLSQGVQGTFGNLSRIKHGTNVVTAYAHLDRFELGLTPGMTVTKGQVIGYIGTTGRSSGPHLHYEVLVDGEHVDPLGVSGSQIAEDVGDGLKKAASGFENLLQQVGNSLNTQTIPTTSLER